GIPRLTGLRQHVHGTTYSSMHSRRERAPLVGPPARRLLAPGRFGALIHRLFGDRCASNEHRLNEVCRRASACIEVPSRPGGSKKTPPRVRRSLCPELEVALQRILESVRWRQDLVRLQNRAEEGHPSECFD